MLNYVIVCDDAVFFAVGILWWWKQRMLSFRLLLHLVQSQLSSISRRAFRTLL